MRKINRPKKATYRASCEEQIFYIRSTEIVSDKTEKECLLLFPEKKQVC